MDNIVISGTPLSPATDEECDDGNSIDGDGCDSSCNIEPNYLCSGEPSICTFCDSEEVILSHLVNNVTNSVQSITFSSFTTKSYTSIPIVLAAPQSDTNGNNYPIPVISNVTTNGFDIQICVDDGNTTCSSSPSAEDIAVFIIDADAASCTDYIEVGTSDIATDGTNTAFTLTKDFSNTPYVFTTPQSSNQ
ncbi:MAG: hypothetical protein H6765_08280 [Candidatus Peribacteria bacterium]|nr:MAG: hypothetical protein H6765_08280 [Candidatus Peribacteria bacterium]